MQPVGSRPIPCCGRLLWCHLAGERAVRAALSGMWALGAASSDLVIKVKPIKNLYLGSVKGNNGGFSDNILDAYVDFFI